VAVTPKSTATLHRITAGSGPGARREVWPASNYQVAAWNYLQVDNLVKLVENRDTIIINSTKNLDHGFLEIDRTTAPIPLNPLINTLAEK